MAIPIILDCDPGTDDAFALLLALASPELEVLAVTVAGGNVGLECTLPNALALVALAGVKCLYIRVPIGHSSARSSTRRACTASMGLAASRCPPGAPLYPASLRMPSAHPAQRTTARDLGRHPPATNLALALMTEPSLAARVERIVLMTGAWGKGTASRPPNSMPSTIPRHSPVRWPAVDPLCW